MAGRPSRRTISAALPSPASKNPALHVARQIFLEPVPLGAHIVDFSQHPSKEDFGRCRGNPRPLKLEDFLPLARDLNAHSFDFSPDMVEVWHGSGP